MTTATRPLAAARLAPCWRAALVILDGRFRRDPQVQSAVVPGERCNLALLLAVADDRSDEERVLLGVANGLVNGGPIDVGMLVNCSQPALRLVLDALAIARGRELPVDWPRGR